MFRINRGLYYFSQTFALLAVILSDVAITLSFISGFLISISLHPARHSSRCAKRHRLHAGLGRKVVQVQSPVYWSPGCFRCQRTPVCLAHYKYERAAFEKRGGAIAQAINKIGIFPALSSLAVVYAGLSPFGIWRAHGLESACVPAILIFHFAKFVRIWHATKDG